LARRFAAERTSADKVDVSAPAAPGNNLAMPRAIWSGTISFGLVNIPVRMYSAIEEKKLRFHFLHTKDDSPIGYDKICKAEGKSVPDDEIGKAFEVSKGEYVYLDDKDFEAARVEGYKTMELTDFVPYEEIDPIYFEKTFYLGPQDGAEKVYSLLVRAMESSELAAIGTYVMRDREQVGCLRVRDGALALERMFFANEIRDIKEVKPRKAQVGKEELRMAQELIDRFTGHFDPKKYKDTYTAELRKIVKAKQQGKEVHVAPPEEEEEKVPDLLEALQASIGAAKEKRTTSRPRKRSPRSRTRQKQAA
jgi:DNA end-binding protein Ku